MGRHLTATRTLDDSPLAMFSLTVLPRSSKLITLPTALGQLSPPLPFPMQLTLWLVLLHDSLARGGFSVTAFHSRCMFV